MYSGASHKVHAVKEHHTENANLRRVLAEAHRLLEAYAPTWYTESLSRKMEAALQPGGRRPTRVPLSARRSLRLGPGR